MDLLQSDKRICTKCKVSYDSTPQFFFKNSNVKGGLNAWCKSCWNEWRREHRKSSPRSKPVPDGKAKCSKCNEVKNKEDFEADKQRFCGITRWCHSCLDLHRKIHNAPEGFRYCIHCRTHKNVSEFYSVYKNRCTLCRSIAKRTSLLAASKRYYSRHKRVIKERYRPRVGGLRGLFKFIDERGDKRTYGYEINKDAGKSRTHERHLGQLQQNIAAAIKDGLVIPEFAVRVAMERVKGISSIKIAKELGLSKDVVLTCIRVLGEGKPVKKDFVFYSWGKALLEKQVNIFQGIRYKKKRTTSTVWTEEDIATVESMFREGATNKQIYDTFQRDFGPSTVIYRKIRIMYLKFGRMFRVRGISTDWSEGGKYSIRTRRYKDNRAHALFLIKKKIGLHPRVVREVIATMRLYNEPEIAGGGCWR